MTEGMATPTTTEVDAPDAERVISDVETLKAISDPLRLRIIETMVTRQDAPWSAKELATALDVPQTRLYHHIELLLERDLIRVAEQRVVSGIIETRYRVAALSLRLDPNLISSGGPGEAAARDVLLAVFDEVRHDLERVFAQAHVESARGAGRPFITRSVARLTTERAGELRRRLEALLEEYDTPSNEAGTETYRLLIAMYADPGSKEDSRG